MAESSYGLATKPAECKIVVRYSYQLRDLRTGLRQNRHGFKMVLEISLQHRQCARRITAALTRTPSV
jgi:hypothetical protein